MSLDIEQWAKLNNLTPSQFKNQIFTMAAALGAMELDDRGSDIETALKFAGSDSLGKIELYVRRV